MAPVNCEDESVTPSGSAHTCGFPEAVKAKKSKGLLQTVQIVPDFGVGPVWVADDLAPNDPLAVNDVGFGPTLGSVHLCDCLVWIAHRVQIHVITVDESAVRRGVRIDADRKNGEIGPVSMQLF